MALGGGSFTTQNKILPGAYINFINAVKANNSLSTRGVVAVGLSLDWGKDDGVLIVSKDEFQKHTLKLFGYAYDAAEMKCLRELFRHATKVIVYRLNGGVKASSVYATAKWSGTQGNKIKTVITVNADDETKFDVSTYFDTLLVDNQIGVVNAASLKGNDFVDFKTDASLAVTAGTALTGGTNETVTGIQHQVFLATIESYHFNILACAVDDATTKGLYVAFTKRLREELGMKFQTVLYNMASDYIGVINVKNSSELVYWVAGAQAGCEVNSSCTNMIYDGECSILTAYTQLQLETSMKDGEFVFHRVGDEFRVLADINSFVTTTTEMGEDFQSNQTVRVLDQIGNDMATIFNTKYLGKIPNDESGRVSLWSDIVSYLQKLQSIRAIEGFDAADVTVEPGETKKAVVVYSAVTPTNCMEKLYMTVVVE